MKIQCAQSVRQEPSSEIEWYDAKAASISKDRGS